MGEWVNSPCKLDKLCPIDSRCFFDGPYSPNAIFYFSLLGTMGMALWWLVKRPPRPISVDKFVAPQKGRPGLTHLCQRQIFCASSRQLASVAIQPNDYEASEGQHAAGQEGDVPEGNLQQGRSKPVVRTVFSEHRPAVKHWLPNSGALQQEAEGAAPEEGSRVLPYVSSPEEATVLRRVPSAHRGSFRGRLSAWDALLFESNVGQDSALGLRLVDDPRHIGDLRIWAELLRFRQRVYGLQGTSDIWEGIKRRKLSLPIRGPQADEFWSSFITCGFERRALLDEVYLHARKIFEKTGTTWRGIYSMIMGHLLATDPKHAYRWHRLLVQIHRPVSSELSYLLTQASTSKVALGAFEEIYGDLEVRTLYANIIPRLCKLELFDSAHRWHYLLLRMGDLPRNFDAVKPLMKYLALYKSSEDRRDLTRSLVDAGVPFTVSTPHAFQEDPVISREIMSRMLGEAHSIAPKSFSDEFCARLFATKAFSIEIVTRGLRILGMDRIGPLSLREIATRDATTEAVAARMDQFRELGMSIGSSIFSRLVKKLAVDGKEDMLQVLLSSDQHPDALEDFELQETLLASYHAAEDWPKFNSTLAILAYHSQGKLPFHKSNQILRSYIRQRNLTAAIGTLEKMSLEKVPVSALSIRLMREGILRPRRVGRRPISLTVGFDDLGILISLWQGILRCGGYVAPLSWREVFRRLGQTGRLEELEKLALWLVVWYHPRDAKSVRLRASPYAGIKRSGSVPRTLSADHPRHPCRTLFSSVQQEAMIAWGFKTLAERPTAARSSSASLPSWTWGLKLLLKLKGQGVAVSKRTVRRALRNRLRILYGPGRSAVPANRLARANNPYELGVMLGEVKVLWKELFTKKTPLPVQTDLHRGAYLPK